MSAKTNAHVSEKTLDDAMRAVIKKIKAQGEQIKPTKGRARELTGVMVEITNPRARLSRTETRGKPYSCLGELCWYLAKTNKLEFIRYYLREYEKSADGDEIFGGYGLRLFKWKGLNQFTRVRNILRKKRDSRQAVIQLFDARDLVKKHNDVPCTCTLQFMKRQGKLHMLTSMRSNDVFLGMPHDIFCFTMLQEIMARSLSVEIGTYKHVVGSLHLYDKDRAEIQHFMGEGWQPTDVPMPSMPTGDPWPSITLLLQAESAIRTEGAVDETRLGCLDPYWADLIRLLQALRCKKGKNANKIDKIKDLRGRMSSKVYFPFIDKVLNQLT